MTFTPRSNTKTPPWAQGDKEVLSFGTWLRQQREVREITLREIADASKISLRYLEAFELDRFDMLPATIFTRGFLRQYAHYVGLDPDEVVNRYLAAQQALQPEEELLPAPKAGSGSNWLYTVLLVLALFLVLILVALAGFLSERRRGGEGPAPAGVEESAGEAPRSAPVEAGPPGEGAASAPPVPSPAAEPPPEPAAAAAPLVVTLEVLEDCWAEIRVDDQRPFQRVLTAGESFPLAAQRAVLLTLGNAGGVAVRVNGVPYRLERGRGQVARVRIDLDTARSLAEAS